MSEEEDKNTINDVDNVAINRSNIEGNGDDQSNNLIVNGTESTPHPCQLDIGLGTHTDSRRHDNNSNVSGKFSYFVHYYI